MRNDNLPTLLGASGVLHPARRDLARIERAVQRDVTVARARAHVIAERGRANARAVEDTAVGAMESAAAVAQHGTMLARSVPLATESIQGIMDQAGLALQRVVSDVARDLR